MIVDDRCTVVFVPCFSGAPWDLKQLKHLARRPLRTMRLPEGVDDIEKYADFLQQKVVGLQRYVIVGDSFGALVALAFSVRQPEGLVGLVLSGGFPVKPVTDKLLHSRLKSARLLPGPLYRNVTLRTYAESVTSPHDTHAEVPWSIRKTRELFESNTPYRSYIARLKAAFSADYTDILPLIKIPTLIMTPSHDMLFGRGAISAMLKRIPSAKGIILRQTGLMFRFTHPVTYSKVVERFIIEKVDHMARVDTERLNKLRQLEEDISGVLPMPQGFTRPFPKG